VGGSSAAPILHRTSTHAYADARPEDRSLGRNVVPTGADDVIGCGDVVPCDAPSFARDALPSRCDDPMSASR